MNLSEGFKESFETIRHNKLRTVLTVLGMNIGVAAVIAVMSVGLMGRGAIMEGIEDIGSTLLWIRINREAYEKREDRLYMKPDDLNVMRDILTDTWISPVLREQYAIGFQGHAELAGVYGVWPDYQTIWGRELSVGRYISSEDETFRNKVIVLGHNTAKAFFTNEEDALGRNVSLGGREFKVVGVMEKTERSPIDDSSDDDTCYIPYKVAESLYDWSAFGNPRILQVYLKVENLSDLDFVSSQVSQFLLARYGEYNGNPRFVVRRAEDNIQTTNKIFDIVTTVITLIAGISLVVGGIGIMNIMLVTVTERTKEIGVRKAVGAKRRDILAQFMIEAVLICLIGGGFGILFGIGLTAILSIAQGWAYLLPWFAISIGMGVSIAIGLFFGIYPAMKAARLDPVTALTRE